MQFDYFKKIIKSNGGYLVVKTKDLCLISVI